MPPNSEIEKLERRWKENPKGTVFAPYAEVLRKHGDHDLAREVLRQGLELHPDHIPGNIVLGRCCLDLREDGPAEAAFTHVLELDVENVIALKALADITERQGRLLEASEWLGRLVSVDPSNDEARDQLGRVEGAREAAAAVITGQISAQAGHAAPPVPEPIPDAAPVAEVGAGEIGNDSDAALDAVMDAFEAPLPPTRQVPSLRAPAAGQGIHPAEAETVPVMPVVRREPPPELEPLGLEVSPRLEAPTAGGLEGMKMDQPFAPPDPTDAPAPRQPDLSTAAELLGVGIEEHSEIELRPSGASEFQSPDDSADLLTLSAGKSEFQVPDAADELTIRPSGRSEFQTPSGSEELLARISGTTPQPAEPPPPEPEAAEPAPSWEPPVYTSGYAAISMSPTEELTTAPPPLVPREPAPLSAALPLGEPPEPAGMAETDSGSVEEGDPAPEPAVAEPAPLKLIFPDEEAEPEPPRRRISEEALEPIAEEAPVEAAAPEPVVAGEPELVVTESMAELYARQGHYAEAANVYQVLLARQPRDARLADRLAAVEAAQQAGRRRLSFVAMETGGESVESFFRSLAEARPGSPGAGGHSSSILAHGEVSDHAGGGAPTRPASDPLSLSAIFGEEPQPHSLGAPPPAAEPPARPAQDAFSFDQFFGGAPAPGGGPAAPSRPSGPREEDLDQFQHWLKSLKR